MKTAFPEILANEALRNRLRDEILGKTLSHAYILEGAKGSGKHTFALQIAAALSCEKQRDDSAPLPCGICPSCRKILGGFSTDVIIKGRGEKATLGVDTVRELRQDVLIAPNDTTVKLYVIEDADLMTVQAQNAFLLTLEEPPSYVLFLLLCESAAPLLETIKSRAPTLRTEPIPNVLLEKHLIAHSSEAATLKRTAPDEFSELLASANGSIGRALSLLDPKTRRPILAKRKVARDFVTLIAGRKSSAATLKFLNALGQKREELSEQLGTVLLCLRDLLVCKQTENAPLCFFADREEACSTAYRFTTPELLTLCDHVNNALESLRMNANLRLTLTNMAVKTGLL